jgi:threonine synthase
MLKQARVIRTKIVCVVTGNGLKDPDIPPGLRRFRLPADLEVIEKHLGLKK